MMTSILMAEETWRFICYQGLLFGEYVMDGATEDYALVKMSPHVEMKIDETLVIGFTFRQAMIITRDDAVTIR